MQSVQPGFQPLDSIVVFQFRDQSFPRFDTACNESINHLLDIPGESSLRYAETIVDPYTKSPEQVVIEAETIRELYAALRSIDERKRSYLLYRYGFVDGDEHLISDTAEHFHLSESRAKSTERAALEEMRTRMTR